MVKIIKLLPNGYSLWQTKYKETKSRRLKQKLKLNLKNKTKKEIEKIQNSMITLYKNCRNDTLAVVQSKNTRKQDWSIFFIFREIQVDHWYTMEFKLGWRLLELLLDVKLVIHRDLQKSVTSEIGFWPTQEYELFKIQNKKTFINMCCVSI